MSAIVARIKKVVPQSCQTSRHSKDGCSVSMKGAPRLRVTVDMDCEDIEIQGHRCDYLFVCGHDNRTWVVLIEMKSGKFRVSDVKDQLQGSALYTQTLLAAGDQFIFVPVLAHGKSVHRLDLTKLRQVKVTLRDKIEQPKLIRCGEPVTKALINAPGP